MRGQIFISYRRNDASYPAGRLYDRLSARFPRNQIFIDVNNLDLGIDFVEEIEQRVASCDVLIAVIGRHWLETSDEQGRRRLDNPADFVRIEIGTALKRDIRVIPVLVEGASMPQSGELPDDLKLLSRRHALELSHTRFDADSEQLVKAVQRELENPQVEPRRKSQFQSDAPDSPSTTPSFNQASSKSVTSGIEWLAEARRYLERSEYVNALTFLKSAVAAGSVGAMVSLAQLYEKGWGVEQDYTKAREWYQKAVDMGDAEAMLRLGMLYEKGCGVPLDYGRAGDWYEKAAEGGNAEAMYRLAQLYLQGARGAENYNTADWILDWESGGEVCRQYISWLRSAAEAGNPDAMYDRGGMYERGMFEAKDAAEARRWYQKASAAGHSDAKQAL
jgi:TIR domain/Sel1 repeat